MQGHYRLESTGGTYPLTRENAEALILAGLCGLDRREGDVRTLSFRGDVAHKSRKRLEQMAESGDEMRFRVEIDASGADYDTGLVFGGKRAYARNERLFAVVIDPERKFASYPKPDGAEFDERRPVIFSGRRCWSQLTWRGPRPIDYLFHSDLSRGTVIPHGAHFYGERVANA